VLGGVDRALVTLTSMMLGMLVALREREFPKKKAAFPFSLLLPLLRLGVGEGCVRDEVVTRWVVIVITLRLKLCGRRRQTVPSDDDVQSVVAVGSGLDCCSCPR